MDDFFDQKGSIGGDTKRKFPLIPLVAVAAVIIVVAGVAWRLLGDSSDPKTAVESAWKATESQWSKDAETLKKEIPVYGRLSSTGEAQASTQNWELTFQSISGVDGAAMYTGFLNGSGLHGTVASDPKQQAAEITAAVRVGGEDLIDGYLYSSPDLVAFHVPSFSKTVLSLDPKTLTDDLRGSRFMRELGLTEQDLQELDAAIQEQLQLSGAAGNLTYSQEKLKADLKELFRPVMETAVFAEGEKADGLDQYVVTLEGAAVRESVLELFRYLYFDSDFEEIYRSSFAPMLEQMGTSYDEFIGGTIMPALEKGLPEIPIEMTVGIDSKKIIRKVHIVGSPVQPAEGEVTLGEIVMDYAYPSLDEQTLKLTTNLSDGRETIDFVIDVGTSYQDKTYQVDVSMAMTGGGMALNLGEQVLYGADGAIGVDLAFDLGDGAASMIKLVLDVDGRMTADGKTDLYEFPNIVMKYQETGSPEISLALSGKIDYTPLEGGCTFSGEHKPVFEMTDSEWAVLSREYQAGAQGLLMRLYSLLLGV